MRPGLSLNSGCQLLTPGQGQFAEMASTNKCLAESNKSCSADKATKPLTDIKDVARHANGKAMSAKR
jgi:hypothetical protein